ncbi:MAG TPA: caspase family protein [Rhodothermales bacterium]|nr:caspase family protein [Rhodothermales bacterium]
MTRQTYLVVAVLFSMIVACGGEAGRESTESDQEGATVAVQRASAGVPTKLALLVGVNSYPHLSRFSQLEGAVNDVERMRTLLTTRFDFPPENVRVLVDENAKHDNILAAFRQHLVANAQPGDIVVFHYSGHGSQLNDETDGDELDGVDETIVPSDSDREGTRDIRDDEINALLAEIDPAASITLIFDSCHSGTVTRDLEGGRARTIDRDSLLTRRTATRGASGSEGLADRTLSYVLLSGARSDQLAKEFREDGKAYGALTYFLTETLNRADSALTYTDLRDIVQSQITTRFANQSPQLEGPSSDSYVFSTASSLAQPHVTVRPLDSEVRLQVQAGAVHGMTKGSVFEIYPPGTKRFDTQNAAIARARLTRVDAFTSEAEVLSGGPVPAAARAIEREHVYPDQEMTLRYDGLASSALLRTVKDSLDTWTHIRVVPEVSDDFDLRLYEDAGQVHIRHDEAVFSEPVPVDAPDAADRVVGHVEQWAKWFNVRGIHHATSESPVKLHLTLDDTNPDTSRPWNEVDEGGTLRIAIENQSDQRLYITGFLMASTGAIQPFYPPAGASEWLAPGARSHDIRASVNVSAGRPFSRDIIKVFATTSPVDLSSLFQGRIRGGPDDPLAALLAQATQGIARDITPMEVGDWYTTQQAIVVRRADRPAM